MYLDRLELKTDPLPRCMRVDLRCRVIGALILIAITVSISNCYVLAALIVLLIMLLIRAIRIVALRLIPVNIFTLMLWASLPLGARFSAFTPIDALVFTLRINAATLLYMLFIIPLGISGLCNALTKLAAPKKLVALLMLTHRYIFVMFERVAVSALSLRMRRPATLPAMARWRTYGALFATALLSAEFRSRKVWLAMQSRGFDGAFPVTKTFRLKLYDAFILAAFIAFALLLLIADKGLTTWIS
jgi:cobalt/nickel transport system permease protein